ncbi:hypothetical protein GCM10007940_04580 [Portibacter lacus]|uniref:IPTL-CTERM protein sorting domain-containing protein n=2 Tax=Portibacter lacus TaxID=1099794 RepID=A0AA37SNI7_9BACT|nr:hypothetical protein GCM10007940_04580 [Portibacter lacus]
MYAPSTLAAQAPGDVGYYNMSAGQGVSDQAAAINNAGFSPVQIFDLSEVELANIDVLIVDNPDNYSYGAEYLAQLNVIENAVNNGLVLVMHDFYVTEAATVLPGGENISILRELSNDAVVDIQDNSTVITNGLDNASLDGGDSSSHGYAEANTLPANSLNILSRTDANESVTFVYPFGAGSVIYSTIPVSHYYTRESPFALNTHIYMQNVVEYAANLEDNAAAVPTLSQWAMIVLSLLLFIFGISSFKSKQTNLAAC